MINKDLSQKQKQGDTGAGRAYSRVRGQAPDALSKGTHDGYFLVTSWSPSSPLQGLHTGWRLIRV